MTKWVSAALGLLVLVTGTVLATLGIVEANRAGDPSPIDRIRGGGAGEPLPGTDLALAAADLTTPGSCEDLLDSYIDRALELVGPWGWGLGGGIVFAEEGGLIEMDSSFTGIPVAGAAARTSSQYSLKAPRTSRITNGDSGTNVQEEGVDEPDLVKVDGGILWRVDDDELTAYDVSGEAPRELSSLELPDVDDAELLLAADRLVAVGRHRQATSILTLDISDPAAPAVVGRQEVSAELLEARLHGDVVRLALRKGLPELDFVEPRGRRGDKAAQEANEQVVRESTLDDWLPLLDGEQLLDCGDVAVPDDEDDPLGTTVVVSLDPADTAGVAGSTAVATLATAAYSSLDRLYLAVSPVDWVPGWGGPICFDCGTSRLPIVVPQQDDGETELFAYAVDGADTTLVASGEVEGTVRDRWSMDFARDSLRVAVGPSGATADENSVITLREEGVDLVEAGRVDGLGVREDIKSVRWFDDLAIVVTFRTMDPLYAIDLTDAGDPELMGELKIPGFSEYLHPLGGRRMIGMGQDASLRGMSRGAQAALFDVTDLTDPQRLDTVSYGRLTQAGAGLDPRQFTWLPERRTALTVVTKGWRTGYVSVLELGNDRMRNRMVEVEHGNEVHEVRLVPLATGKVVLVTGDDVSFLDL